MSDQAPPPPPSGQPGPSQGFGEQPTPEGRSGKRETKANLAAEKARAKAERPWYKKKRAILPLGLLLIIIIAVATSGGGDDAPDTAADTDEAAPADEAAPGDEAPADEAPADEAPAEGGDEATTTGIGSPAADGQFEFTVDSFECGETSVGDDMFGEEAQGQFCLLGVRVENIGDAAQPFSATDQYVFSEEGTEYSASFEATFANNPEGDELFTEINPGNAVEGVIVFDIPADAEAVYAELHDSPFSDGVRVELR